MSCNFSHIQNGSNCNSINVLSSFNIPAVVIPACLITSDVHAFANSHLLIKCFCYITSHRNFAGQCAFCSLFLSRRPPCSMSIQTFRCSKLLGWTSTIREQPLASLCAFHVKGPCSFYDISRKSQERCLPKTNYKENTFVPNCRPLSLFCP